MSRSVVRDAGWSARCDQIEANIERILSHYEVAGAADLKHLERLADAMGVRVESRRIDGADGYAVRGARGTTIAVSGRLPAGPRRFAIGHELGHFRLHEDRDQLFICTRADMLDFYRSSSLEREANTFSARLLMPTRYFAPLARKKRPAMDSVVALATEFGTSLTAAALRMVDVSDEACAVVVSNVTGVEWWHPGQHFGVAVDRKRCPAKESFAFDALQGAAEDRGSHEVDPETWLYFEHLHDDRRLCESSMVLGHTGRCLTILWICD